MEKVENLNKLKTKIESMEKHHQIEILKILSKNLCKINEKAAEALADPEKYANLFPDLDYYHLSGKKFPIV